MYINTHSAGHAGGTDAHSGGARRYSRAGKRAPGTSSVVPHRAPQRAPIPVGTAESCGSSRPSPARGTEGQVELTEEGRQLKRLAPQVPAAVVKHLDMKLEELADLRAKLWEVIEATKRIP